MSDLEVAWAALLLTAVISFVLGFVYIMLMRCCAGVIVWTIILFYFVLLAAFAYFLYIKADDYAKLKEEDAADGKIDENFEKYETYCRYGSYTIGGIFLLSILIFFCILKSIRITIAIMEAASEFVQQVAQSILVPIFVFILMVIFFAYWFIIALYLYSSGKWTQRELLPFGQMEWNKYIRECLIYHLFALLWNISFLMAFSQFVIASACCMWYFKKSKDPKRPVSRSIFRGLCNHLGSLAFGSFVLALIWFIKIVLTYMMKKMQPLPGQTPSITQKTCMKFLACCITCFERFIKFLNKHAYIEIALTGKNFCLSAKQGFYLILKQPVKLALVTGLGNIIIVIGEVFVAVFAALFCYLALTKYEYYEGKIFAPFFPTLFALVIGYSIGSIFMSVYGMAANTILHCYILDAELHNEYGDFKGVAQFAPEKLKKFAQEHAS